MPNTTFDNNSRICLQCQEFTNSYYIVVIKYVSLMERESVAFLPYVLNPLNPLILVCKLMGVVQINNNNINSKLQYILQNCKFIEDIIILVSAHPFLSDSDTNQRIKGYRARPAFLFYAPSLSTHRFWDHV